LPVALAASRNCLRASRFEHGQALQAPFPARRVDKLVLHATRAFNRRPARFLWSEAMAASRNGTIAAEQPLGVLETVAVFRGATPNGVTVTHPGSVRHRHQLHAGRVFATARTCA
jgi:hypothetical protein